MIARSLARSVYIMAISPQKDDTEIISYAPTETMESMSTDQLQKLLQGPAGRPPPGVEPNLMSPANQRISGQAAILVCFIAASISLFMRIYTRIFVIRKTNMSDYSIIVAWVETLFLHPTTQTELIFFKAIYVSFGVISWLGNDAGPGVDMWNLRLTDFRRMQYWFHTGSILYGICIFFIKASILLQIVDIFVPTKRNDPMFWICHALIWINFLFYLISSFLEIFACRPLNKAWDPLITQGSCMDMFLLIFLASLLNAASDLIILILPQTRIWRLQMPLSRKVAVSAVFLFGVIACVSSIVKLAFAVSLMQNKENVSYYSWLEGVWPQPEIASGIVVACLPVLPKLFNSLKQNNRIARMNKSLQVLLPSLSFGSWRNTGTSRVVTSEIATTACQSVQTKDCHSDDYPLISLTAERHPV
ncbi:hypothetical protein ANOM_003110 [Aspergillus nomiae NRRL 13137]|uniref:Rhodopsin domain-containing protein n=1 Tax=Aspergillus nomiae NRRL (strain ATCC 15546 / NRRL 13137 / CBS 260.88 / M93) TaxID=1509407 RepID=A0A0L1JAF0_ASPN3|nr:uncharacterized protein ANOM_003110 [Aspergillus nomiae NRRL 13137]KNG88687.1 hypothetical protein ANOM_003110 [Aspergillus nomiae NRRL 13137]